MEEGATLQWRKSLQMYTGSIVSRCAHLWNQTISQQTSNNFQIETKIDYYPIGWNNLGRTGDTRIMHWLQDEPAMAELKKYSTKDNLR